MKKNIIHKSILVLLASILIVFISNTGIIAENEESFSEKRVLYISSYSPVFITFFQQIDGIKATFEGYPISLDIEFMDTKRLFTDENITNFYTSLHYKLNNLPPYDLIMVADDNGLNFVVEKQDELFADIPIVFLGINSKENSLKYGSTPLITGVSEDSSIDDTIRLALDLNSNASQVIALSDGTPSGQADLIKFYEEASNFTTFAFDDISLNELSFDAFTDELNALDDTSVIIMLSAYRDVNGESIDFSKSVELITSNTTQPVYHPYQHGIGEGLIGGRVISHYEQGVKAAEMVLSIFHGTDIQNIPVIMESPNRYMIDFAVFESFGLDLEKLPISTIFINRELSFFEQYAQYIIFIVVFIIVQTLVIAILLWNVVSRHKAQKEIIHNKMKLQLAYDELETTNEELTATVTDLNDSNLHLEQSMNEINERDERIHTLVYLDPLTDLMNRFALSEFIEKCIETKDTIHKMAIIFIDVDNFKNVNDTFGHDIGDKVIAQTGQRLDTFTSDTIHVGRFGGDEFLIIVTNDSVNELETLAKTISEVFTDVVTVAKNRFFLTVSIGIVTYPEHGHSMDELVKKADIALYEAKNSGKNKYIFYHEYMNKNLLDKIEFQMYLKEGFNNHELYLNFQPIHSLDLDDVVAFEALIRWHSDELGQVSPFRLVTEAEEMGLIVEIGEFVFKEACKFIKHVNTNSDNPVYITVNISAVQLMFSGLYDQLVHIIREVDVNPKFICLEMTETILIENISSSMSVIHALRNYGFRIALDDFGTGYSSLNYLKNLPIDILKIDKSFIDTIIESRYDRYIVEAVLKIASQRNLLVVAEGVEIQAQLDLLNSLGCNMIQGYLFSKPLSYNNAIAYLTDQS